MNIYRKTLIIYIYVVSSFLLVQILFEIVIAPNFKIRYIQIESQIKYDKEELIKLADIDLSVYYYNVDEQYYAKNIKKDLRVKDVFISKVFPNKLIFTINKRSPIAIAYESEELLSYYLIGEDGIILERRENLDEDLVVLSGINFKNAIVGDYLEPNLIKIVKDLNRLKNNQNNLYNLISEISFEKVNFYEVRGYLYLSNINIKFLINEDIDLKDTLINIISFLPYLERNSAREVDLRTGNIIILGDKVSV